MQTTALSHISKIQAINLHPHHPAISVDDLAVMVEIDSVLGRRDELRHRLQKALDDAFTQGTRFQTHARALTGRKTEGR